MFSDKKKLDEAKTQYTEGKKEEIGKAKEELMMLATQYHYRVTWNKVPKVSISFIDFMEGGWGLTCRK